MLKPTVILAPSFEDSPSVSLLLQGLSVLGIPMLHVLIVDDGSVEHPTRLSSAFPCQFSITILQLRQNTGHQRAIAIGINYIADNFPASNVVIMDADGEDMPSDVLKILRKLGGDRSEIVVASRRKRSAPFAFNVLYNIYKAMFKVLTGNSVDFGNFMGLKSSAIQRLSCMPELWSHLPGCVILSKMRFVRMPLDRGVRYLGESRMNFNSLILHGLRGIMVFSELVMTRLAISGAIIASISLLTAPLPLILKLLGLATPGWASSLSLLCFMLCLQATSITVICILLLGIKESPHIQKVDYCKYISNIYTNVVDLSES